MLRQMPRAPGTSPGPASVSSHPTGRSVTAPVVVAAQLVADQRIRIGADVIAFGVVDIVGWIGRMPLDRAVGALRRARLAIPIGLRQLVDALATILRKGRRRNHNGERRCGKELL